MTSPETREHGGSADHRTGTWFWIAGIVSIVLGGLAILFPFSASMAAELLIGVVLVASGVMEVVRAFYLRKGGRILWNALFGVLGVIAGLILLTYPLTGVLTLTLVFAGFFILGGVFKFAAALGMRPEASGADVMRPAGGWKWLALSGALSLLLGVILFLGLPGSAVWALGLLLGIDFLFLGFAEIRVATAIGRGEI